jgi:hypothetical protein
MDLNKPDFVEIKMDAEISSYQEADEPTRDPQFATREETKTREGDAQR